MSLAHSTPSKRCSKCRTVKPMSDFGVETRRPDGRRCFCKECGAKDSAAYYSSPTYKQNKFKARIKYQYGLTVAEYERMLAEQGGCCALCGSDRPYGRWDGKFFVDHNHRTGKVRGLLCRRCNVALASWGDDLSGILKVVKYVQRGE